MDIYLFIALGSKIEILFVFFILIMRCIIRLKCVFLVQFLVQINVFFWETNINLWLKDIFSYFSANGAQNASFYIYIYTQAVKTCEGVWPQDLSFCPFFFLSKLSLIHYGELVIQATQI